MTKQPSDDTLEQIRAAEAAAQRSVCNMPSGKTPDELEKALDRRVEVNAAQHTEGRPVTRVGGTDPQVRELEAPWRRRKSRETPQDGGRQRRTAKKASTRRTAKKAAPRQTQKENS